MKPEVWNEVVVRTPPCRKTSAPYWLAKRVKSPVKSITLQTARQLLQEIERAQM
jgi:hypothetical protein